ncbi:MAG: hypothetical protein ACRDPE_15220 [Solirubrobacterales bacterium]
MPAQQKHPSPPEQLRALAEKAKAEGKSFDEFWDAAMPPLVPVPIKEKGEIVGWKTEDDGSPMERPERRLPRVNDPEPPADAVLWPDDTFDRNNWFKAIVWGKDGWRRTYEGLSRSSDRALAMLARR